MTFQRQADMDLFNRNIAILVVALLSIFATMVELEVDWDGKQLIKTSEARHMLQIIVSGLTLLLLILILRYWI